MKNSWVQGSPPFITYGFGLAIGGWLCMDFDWRNHHVIYHGWNRPGWVNHARPYIHVPNVYINRSRSSINQTWRHDMSHGDPERFRASQPGSVSTGRFAHTPEVRGRETTPAKRPGVIFGPRGDTSSFSNRGRQSLGTINQRQTPPAAVSVDSRPCQFPGRLLVSVAGSSQPVRPAKACSPPRHHQLPLAVTGEAVRQGRRASAASPAVRAARKHDHQRSPVLPEKACSLQEHRPPLQAEEVLLGARVPPGKDMAGREIGLC